MTNSTKEYLMFPKGTAVFPALDRPDTKFDELGMYKADVRIPEADAKPIIAKLTATCEEHGVAIEDERKNNLWEFETDEDGSPNGNVVFKLRVKNRMTKAGKLWDRRPLVIDRSRMPISADTPIWGGSEIVVKAEVRKWEFNTKRGVQLQPVAVQVIELVSGGGQHMSDFEEFDTPSEEPIDVIPESGGADY